MNLQQIRDALGDSICGLIGAIPIIKENKDDMDNIQKAMKALQALDTLIASIPEGLDEAVAVDELDDLAGHDKAAEKFKLKYDMRYWEKFEEAAKLLQQMK